MEKLDSMADGGHDEMQDVWVLIGDTSRNYFALDAEMYLWAGQLNWGIDTMERYYNLKKKALVVSEKVRTKSTEANIFLDGLALKH